MSAQNLRIPGPVPMPDAVRAALANQMINHRGSEFKLLLGDVRARLGLRPIINVSGTMTALGASIMVPEAVQAMVDIALQFVEIDDLQRKASSVIA